jgi:hypothetical protein
VLILCGARVNHGQSLLAVRAGDVSGSLLAAGTRGDAAEKISAYRGSRVRKAREDTRLQGRAQ